MTNQTLPGTLPTPLTLNPTVLVVFDDGTTSRLTAQSGSWGPWYGVTTYRQARGKDGRRLWQSTGGGGRLNVRAARETGLSYGTLHGREVESWVRLPPGASCVADLPPYTSRSPR